MALALRSDSVKCSRPLALQGSCPELAIGCNGCLRYTRARESHATCFDRNQILRPPAPSRSGSLRPPACPGRTPKQPPAKRRQDHEGVPEAPEEADEEERKGSEKRTKQVAKAAQRRPLTRRSIVGSLLSNSSRYWRANGARYRSLGRSPRDVDTEIDCGLKARVSECLHLAPRTRLEPRTSNLVP